MTILTALERLYDRMQERKEAPPFGYSIEKISFALVIDAEGRPLGLADKRSHVDKKSAPVPVPMVVPEAVKRSVNIGPNRFWDKTAYVFGVTAIEEEDENGATRRISGQGKRTAEEHDSFVTTHLENIPTDTTDPGLVALRRFLEQWKPDRYADLDFPTEALDSNIVFEFDDGSGKDFIHKRPAVADLLTELSDVETEDTETEDTETGLCLVTGEKYPLSRLHPKIKGVMGAQSSGASLVSFNNEAYESFGKSQGFNSPVSEYAAFAYGTALNILLARGSDRNIRIGDTTVAFWAEAPRPEAADLSELFMGQVFQPPDEDAALQKLHAALSNVAEGRAGDDPGLDPAARIYILGLAPNAARLSVRFWHLGTFGDFARHVIKFWKDLEIEPSPWQRPPAVWSLLYETAVRVGGKPKADTIPPLLGGQVMRAVLTGLPLPRTLLSAVIGRIRADGGVNGRRAAICRAVINRTMKEEKIPVSLDPKNIDSAYRLGRLFAVLERAQSAALPGLNATIKDRYFSAASATPARVFPLLVRNATHHLALLKKGEGGGLGHWLEKQLGTIWLGLEADMPRALSLEDQGRFIAGYYHQRWTKTTKEEDTQ